MNRLGAWMVVCTLLSVAPTLAHAASSRELIEQGNEHYAAGRFADALEAYQQAAEDVEGELGAELLHNRAAAQFKLGNTDEARELWVRALSLRDSAFEARARYNLGNCDYTEALRAVESQNSQGVLEALGRAVQQYRDAVRLDPSLESARANLELAHQLKKQLEEQATTQPQSQSSTQKGDQQQDQTSQPSDQQQQGESGEQDQQDESTSSQPSTQPNEPQPQSQPDESSDEQSEDQPQPQEGQLDQPEEQPQPMHMTREQAERLLQQIRDAEKARRRVLLQRQKARHKPVERDW